MRGVDDLKKELKKIMKKIFGHLGECYLENDKFCFNLINGFANQNYNLSRFSLCEIISDNKITESCDYVKNNEDLLIINLAIKDKLSENKSNFLYLSNLLDIARSSNVSILALLNLMSDLEVYFLFHKNKQSKTELQFKMYNVGFGSSNIIFKENDMNKALLVDCGSQNPSKIKNTIKEIEADIKNFKKIDCLITHFHYDHYSCLKQINPDIENIFIYDPFYYPQLLELSFYSMTIEEFLENKVDEKEGYKLARFFMNDNLFSVAKDKEIIFLSPGSIFDFLERKFIVLKKEKQVNKYLRILIKLKKELDEIRNELEPFFKKIDKNSIFFEALKKIKKYSIELEEFQGNDIKKQIFRDRDLYRLLVKIFYSPDFKLELSDEEKRKLININISLKFLINENDINIAFVDLEHNILVTGDTPKATKLINELEWLNNLTEQNIERFKIVTAPHHGLQSFFKNGRNKCSINEVIKSDFVCISWADSPYYGEPAISEYSKISDKIFLTNLNSLSDKSVFIDFSSEKICFVNSEFLEIF